MIEKRYIVTCDWCGREEFFGGDRKETLSSYSRRFWLYRHSGVNPLADELHAHAKGLVPRFLMFCCEGCAEEYFRESPEDVPHYRLVGS